MSTCLYSAACYELSWIMKREKVCDYPEWSLCVPGILAILGGKNNCGINLDSCLRNYGPVESLPAQAKAG